MYKPIPRFNDHGATCKGHSNWMLDSELTTREDRDIVIHAIENYLPKNNLFESPEQTIKKIKNEI